MFLQRDPLIKMAALTTMVIVLSASSGAQPLTVSPQSGSQGEWIHLFDGETLFGWNVLGDAQWTVVDGVLTCESGSGGWIATTSQFADFELSAKVRVKPGASSGLVVRGALEGHPTENGGAMIVLVEPQDASPRWREVNIVAAGGNIRAIVDGEPVEGLQAARSRGYIGVLYHHNNAGKVEVSEMKLRPLGLKDIFNGKDLSGWNIIPDLPSKFAVVDGALNITDGKGQIETADVYKDFLLQIDIISNGDHLNSGVFYRGPVGVFWKGYESQIRNQWEGDDRSKPVDFGTGGIYGNQPARRVASTDREWFTKTIVCEGNHTAVWVNGYQVSDFTDTRAVSPDANGKAGYVPGPGTIHLQGHDKTTDLSFKNIRIQEYPSP